MQISVVIYALILKVISTIESTLLYMSYFFGNNSKAFFLCKGQVSKKPMSLSKYIYMKNIQLT